MAPPLLRSVIFDCSSSSNVVSLPHTENVGSPSPSGMAGSGAGSRHTGA